LFTRYFRKKDPSGEAAETEWIEMSGREYYRFVTAPENRDKHFIDMGDVVLECSEAEYKKFKAEDDHSSYILEQTEGWLTLSLYELGDGDRCSGEELIPDEDEDVCDLAIRNIQRHALQNALQRLSEDEYRMIMLKYHSRFAMSEEKIGELFGLSQSGVNRRLAAIKNSLKKFVIEAEKSSQ
jgi:RNA polymerase sigma factor (sigma-70 family)